MFAVIKTGGKQYKVAANDLVRIEKIPGDAGEVVTFDNVLMVGDAIGTPLVEGALVAGEVVEQFRDKKVIVFKKKRRQGYRRTLGHRQELTLVRITEILTGGAKPSGKKAAAPKKTAAKTADTKAAEAKPAEKKAEETAPKAKEKAPKAAPAAAEGVKDDVKLIGGVGPALEKKLAGLGVTSLSQIAAWTAEDIERVDGELNFKGRIEREEWVEQAKELLAGKPPRAKADQ
ncbi:50S ribosomal protein L21 [Pelagibacterium sediminicola]|uniref:50S ribosomal protein L21 n=1 Tax=Pelagibacterium sediminicola TaxID=2248761 RepID=UPI000E3213BF|nr:50S ribosomal protein L21 [Pelagibacterium sediminicola]